MEILLIYFGAGAALLILGVLLFLRSRSSRRTYTCPHCGERVTVELMGAKHCNMCGAPLDE